MTAAERIAQNLSRVRRQMHAAAQRAGRSPDEVRLIAVTKYVDAALTRAVFEAGCVDLAESRPQALWSKAAELRDLPIHWHLVGHLQRNKTARTLPHLTLLHSLDSLRLAAEIDRAAAAEGLAKAPILVEVHISAEESKQGVSVEALETFLEQAHRNPHLEIRGLMGMAPLEGGLAAARNAFRTLRECRDRLQPLWPGLRELSMGMSHDFEAAIEEGATLVRVGSALFEGLAG